ncbi:MAG: hypothetical protein BWY89_01678 [Bacteroidetes bacterium ADurb.BinA012]|nr:MAG: hypothetical protein BWY89_01678 [Bacteroidetes bacterium ADurb.BinA012]
MPSGSVIVSVKVKMQPWLSVTTRVYVPAGILTSRLSVELPVITPPSEADHW